MKLQSTAEEEIRQLIREHGRITFAQFMHTCLYSPRGGFYASGTQAIGSHFGTSPTSHPVFGALIARQLEQMWHLLGEPAVFHAIEVGAGDGSLARSIVHATRQLTTGFARALCYVAADYQPRWPRVSDGRIGRDDQDAAATSGAYQPVHQVKTAGLHAFRNLVGCVLSNELIDNFPVHRFAIQDGRVKEVFVTVDGGNLVELLDEPSSARIEERLAGLGLSLADGYRGEVNLAVEDWTNEAARALERGYVLTIDYGERATDLYSPANSAGTLVCYHRHAARKDPYEHIGEQDITCHVDFTTLMRLGERNGLTTLGYVSQREFLTNLGFAAFLGALEAQGLSEARETLSRMAMTALVDPEEYGDLKVLAQAKGMGSSVALRGFAARTT